MDPGSFMIGIGIGVGLSYVLWRYGGGMSDRDAIAPPELEPTMTPSHALAYDAGVGLPGVYDIRTKNPGYAPAGVQAPPYQPQGPDGQFRLPQPIADILRELAQSGVRVVMNRVIDGVRWVVDEAMGTPVVTATPQGFAVDRRAIDARLQQVQ